MQIRGMELLDQPSVRVAGEALAARYYPELIPDIDREVQLLGSLRFDTSCYTKVIGPVGNPDAALIARTGTNLWALRRHATILLWYSKKPGAGYALLKDFVKWTTGQKHVVLAGVIDDFGMRSGVIALLRRAGFIQRGGAHLFFPRGAK